jgi:putative PIN family toxin of toxin-antitoxin system
MPAKAVVDTNVWVSYFINDRINYLVKWMLDHDIEVFISDELIREITEVLQRPKFSQRKNRNDIFDFIDLLVQLGSHQKVKTLFKNSPDADDNFLFDLCLASEAEYLITSDKKLLNFSPGFELSIITFSEFRKLFS